MADVLDNFGGKSATGGSMPAWFIPAVLAGGQALGAYGQNKAQNAQQQQQNQQLQLTREQVQMNNLQQQRENALKDQQSAAVNPMRQQLFSALAKRLGLPDGALSFNVAPQAVAQQRAQAVPAQAAAQTQAAASRGAGEASTRAQMEMDLAKLRTDMAKAPGPVRSAMQQIERQLAQRLGVA
jgi:hypothetical protein